MRRRTQPPQESPLLEAMKGGTHLVAAFVHLPRKDGKPVGLRAGVILSQAFYMSKRYPQGWEYQPSDWMECTGLSEDQASRALKTLVDAGYLSRWQRSRVRVLTYRLEILALEKALLSRAPITANLRPCKTADSRPCKTADSRASLYRDSASSKEEARGRKSETQVQRVQQRAVRQEPDSRAPVVASLGTTKANWLAFAESLSVAWVASGDAAGCWDELHAVGWIDKSRRRVKEWEPKARRLYGIWLHDRGGKAIENRHAATVTESAGAKDAAKEARRRFQELQELAEAGKWSEVRAGEAAWRVADSRTFQTYVEKKRPPEWLRQIAALAARSAQKGR